MLIALYGFAPRDIVTLTDQAATRAAILKDLEGHLLRPATRGDVLLFYFAGHGSQVRNSLSDEPDKLDESLVPADSRLGARDIRDKELRLLFNHILDHGARLSVLLDSCHSGSGARGLPTGAHPRGIKPDLRDVADGSDPGPRPEDRGALVLAAAEDFDIAWETRDEQGKLHGVFSWAWARALRDAVAGEPAADTFLRAQARMRAETPFQQPVLAGSAQARLSPFLGVRQDRRADRAVVAVEKVAGDGTVAVAGGWANGLTPGSELRLAGPGAADLRLEVTAMRGVGRCEARIVAAPARPLPAALRSGALLEVVAWAAPPGKPLRVWMPRISGPTAAALELPRELAREAARGRLGWVDDPTEQTPSHLLRWQGQGWELLAPAGETERLGPAPSAAAVLAKVRPGRSSLFVQLPAPLALVQGIAVGPGTDRPGVEPTDRPEEADYFLVGRLAGAGVEYAWLRPLVGKGDLRRSGLPERTAWQPLGSRLEGPELFHDAALVLEDAVLRLRKIHAWHLLESPPHALSAYRLAIRRTRDGKALEDPAVVAGKEEYGLVLRTRSTPPPARVEPRFFYVFAVDSYGKSVLLFPPSGSVENRFPLAEAGGQTASSSPAEIPLGPAALFAAATPYGVDTFFLLSSDEPLPNPWILEWDGVRSRGPRGESPLAELLALTGGASRSLDPIHTSPNWSIERLLVQSVPPNAQSAR
jgi:hypothetical protein